MEEAKIKAAEALYPLLSHFHKIEDQTLQAVWQFVDCDILSRIVLVFETVSLLVEAETDYDTVDFSVKESIREHKTDYRDVSQLEPWKQFIEKPFVWGWVTINKQGYCDGLLLSFDTITPNVILNVVASEIKVGIITI